MKRQLIISALCCIAACISVFSVQGSHTTDVTLAVYGESDTGYSWVRTYTGREEHLADLVGVLQDSYMRLAESMGAGSAMKIYIHGTLIAEAVFEGEPKTSYSGLQISVHDRFARHYDFTTQDVLPRRLEDLETPVEPFVCGGKP